MEYVYLGLFQKVFDWVLKNILSPVYKFVSNLLMTVLTWVFQEILAPILLPVLETAFNTLLDLWKQLYSTQLYLLFSSLLKLIDYLEKAFNVFIGLEDVTYTEANGVKVTGSLVEVLMQQKTVSTVFWMLTLGALGLALMLTIYATAKSAFDLDFENKRPVSKVLAAMMKTFVQFFTVPFFVYFFLKLSAIILKSVTSVLSFGGETSLGRIVFTIASLNASKTAGLNLSDAAAGIELGTSEADWVRYPFYCTTASGAMDYGNLKQVGEKFNLADFDYVIGLIAAVFLLFTIGVCLIVFVQRIFELVMLYIASPYFVCMIPLDDGERFSRWREMFVGKCFTGFGSAIGMRLFLMICPMVMGNRIRFGTATSPEMDYMMKLFFLAGGAWAVYKSGSMITSLLSSQAGASEANTAAMAGGMLYAYTAGKIISKGQQVMGSALHSRGGGRGAERGSAAGGQEPGSGLNSGQSGKFEGKPGAAARASRYGTNFRIRRAVTEKALGGQDSRRRKVAGALSYAGKRGVTGMAKDGARLGARRVLGNVGPGGASVDAKDFRIHTALKERALGAEGSRRRKAADVMQYVGERGAAGVVRDQARRGVQRMMSSSSSGSGAYKGVQRANGRTLAQSRQVKVGNSGYTVGGGGEVISRSFPGSILAEGGIHSSLGLDSLDSGSASSGVGSSDGSYSSDSRSSMSIKERISSEDGAFSGSGSVSAGRDSSMRSYSVSAAPLPVVSVRSAGSVRRNSSAGESSPRFASSAGGERRTVSYSDISVRGLTYRGSQDGSGKTFTRRNTL